MSKRKSPAQADADRCFEIRCRSKRGQKTTRKENEFCQLMAEKYPKWYDETQLDVFNETRPFGAFERSKP